MCGSGHYSMKGIIVVETQEEYNKWLADKKPQYVTVMEAKKTPVAAADSATAKPIAALSK
jgi:cytochrome c oxidase subunit 2